MRELTKRRNHELRGVSPAHTPNGQWQVQGLGRKTKGGILPLYLGPSDIACAPTVVNQDSGRKTKGVSILPRTHKHRVRPDN